jgi:hypothetical protein
LRRLTARAFAPVTACPEAVLERATCLAISSIELDSSSVAVATV